jgi:peptidoglycan/xylan/chitin deacetylase (PgdA/CDA1 family)
VIKRAIKQTFASPWGWRLFGPVLRRPGVIVLMYHRILGADRALVGLPVEEFAAQMAWLRDNCDPIHPDELRARATRGRRPRPAVLVTFDDGYRDYHDLAYPILRKQRIPAVVFLATSFMDEGGMIWTDTVQWACLSTTKSDITWRGDKFSLAGAEARAAFGQKARNHLKSLPDGERKAAVDALLRDLGSPPSRERQMLTWDEVRAASELTVWGGHSHTHPILSRLDRAAAAGEIRACRDRITAETGRAPKYFAYPNGRPADFTAETQQLLRENGFDVAFATSEGIAGADSDWMAVRRLPGEAAGVADFAWLAAGLSRG